MCGHRVDKQLHLLQFQLQALIQSLPSMHQVAQNSSPIAVTVIPVTGPPATITSSNGTAICPGDNVTSTANVGSAYLWTPGGQTTRSITVSAAGNYSVLVTDISGMGASTADVDITLNPVPSAPAIMSAYIPGFPVNCI